MKRKERATEKKFKEWLDRHEIPYWYIQQDVDTFSKALKMWNLRSQQKNMEFFR